MKYRYNPPDNNTTGHYVVTDGQEEVKVWRNSLGMYSSLSCDACGNNDQCKHIRFITHGELNG